MAKQKNIDVIESLKYFFKLNDWIERCLLIGGTPLIGIVIYLISFLFAFIPAIGPCIFCCLLTLLALAGIAYGVYLTGYKYALIKALVSDKNVEEIKVFDNINERFKKGLKILLGNLVYISPLIIAYIISYLIMFVPIFLGNIFNDNNQTDKSIISNIFAFSSFIMLFISYIPMFLGWVYQVFFQYFLKPSSVVIFSKDKKIRSMLNFKECWQFLKSNFVNLLSLLAVNICLSLIFGILLTTSMVLIFICIGIVIIPILVAFFTTYILHIQAHLIGQLIKNS